MGNPWSQFGRRPSVHGQPKVTAGVRRSTAFQPGAVLSAGGPGSRYENAVAPPNTDGDQGTFFCWVKYVLPSLGSIFELQGSGSGQFFVQPQSDGQTNVLGENTAGVAVLTELSTVDKLPSGVWTAIMVSWDLTSPVANYFFQPLDGAAINVANVDIPVIGTIDLDGTPASIYGGSGTGINLLGVCFSQLMMDNTVYTDFSIPANREKFVTSAGKPKDLGADASPALGFPAEFYLPNGDIRGVPNWLLVGGNIAVVSAPGPV